MDVTFAVAGSIRREYILPPSGAPLLDAAGGSALYACSGLLTWAGQVGLLARVGEDYPRTWLKSIEARGVDIDGIKILQRSVDLRDFIAYDAGFVVTRTSPVTQFARRKLPFPKSLLGYQPPSTAQEDARRPGSLSPTIADVPGHYREARAIHLCALDFVSHQQLASAFKTFGANTITVDPAPGYMTPGFLPDMRAVAGSATAILTSESLLRGLFWGSTYDLWEMMSALGSLGCEVVVARRGAAGQAVYDAKGKHRWEIPAYPARAADPIGAGDAFSGGFLAGFKRTYDPLQAALHGNVSASLKIEGSGAFYGLSVIAGLAEARLHVLRDMVREA